MSRRQQVLVALGLLTGLAVAWWWWRRDPAPPTTPAVATRPKPTAEAPGRSGSAGDVPSVPLRVMIDADPRGELRLEGMVIDADDKPVAGVTVVLGANPPRSVTTGEDGGFEFDALVGRPYTLVARGDAGIAGPVTAKLTATSEPVVLHLRPASKVRVAVVDAKGTAVDGATVELRGIDDQRATTTAGQATFATVVPGSYQVAAWARGRARALQWLQVGVGVSEATLTLVDGARVSGTVLDDKGAPVAGARVVYSGASDWSAQGDERRDAVMSQADGSFAFEALPAGSFRFVANHDQLAQGTSTLITLDGTNERTGVTITLTAGAAIRGRVLDANQQPVASARVRIGVASTAAAMLAAPPRQAFTDASGVFEIAAMPRRELVAVAIHETAASPSVKVDATRGDVAGVTLMLDVTGTIAGVVVDPTGQPIEGVQVSAGPNFRDPGANPDMSQWRLRGFPQELTDAAGRFTLTGLAPGSYLVNAMRPQAASRGRRGFGEGVAAQTGRTDLKLVLQPEGAVRGKVVFADGTAPAAYTVSIGMTSQSFARDAFELDALAPGRAELAVRGPSFQPRVVEVVIEGGKTVDVGTITVEQGRGLAGIVTVDGRPVPNAKVYAGKMIFGSGSSSSAQFGPMGRGTKEATTAADGTFALSGFLGGDLTIVAEEPTIGRSRSLRVPSQMPGQTELTLELQPFGALAGILRQSGKPAEGVFVTAQSTTTPGALYNVASGPDGSYRFDRLAPDSYKVSATLGMPMTGMKFYSKQVEVVSGKETVVDLTVEPGTVTLVITAMPGAGQLGVANVWLTSGEIAPATAAELALRMAALGPGASQWVIIRNGEPARFAEVATGRYTACVVPFPSEVKGMAAMGYAERHGDELHAFCKQLTVSAAPATQSAEVPVEIPAKIEEPPPPGAGSGSGSATP
ncbi:MAG: carboxypeptidase-like regulatory domain-containing protein [Kofleriaceae bacterium]|nr:carboxypeptidase-like regulatory domain-containing protein [Kofleriaceae bacterium]